MIGKLEKNYYKVGVAGNNITLEDIHECLEANLDGMFVTSKMDKGVNPEAVEETCDSLEVAKEQPTVPVQFIYYEDEKRLCYYDHAMGVAGNGNGFVKNCTVEQIGAVLYVRGE